METLVVPNYPPPPPPPAKRMSRPKITLQMPDATSPVTPRSPTTPFNFGHSRYKGRAPMTPVSIPDPQNPYFNPFVQMYHNKASEFMFKQFEGFKDFTMNTAKSGLSVGEKSAFWFVNKLKVLSKRWFTHFFLTICLVVYSIIGAAVFMALEAYKEEDFCLGRRAQKVFSLKEVSTIVGTYLAFFVCRTIPILCYFSLGIFYLVCQSCCCFLFCS